MLEGSHPIAEEIIVTDPTLADAIRDSLLTSAHVDEVLQVRTTSTDEGLDVVAVRVALTNVSELTALPPVLADVRHRIREAAPEAQAIFVEPDVIGPERANVTTEAIVFRGWD